ncbi:MAG: hypothetical protein WCJ30_14055, partial [Deltaproteobacteria bacterium]
MALAAASVLEPRVGSSLDVPACEPHDGGHAWQPLPPPDPRSSGHLSLGSPCGDARLDMWNGGPSGVMAQLVWRGADARGGFVGVSAVAPFRVRAMTPAGTFVPGATHTLRAVSRESAWIDRCVGTSPRVCELMRASPGGALVSLGDASQGQGGGSTPWDRRSRLTPADCVGGRICH